MKKLMLSLVLGLCLGLGTIKAQDETTSTTDQTTSTIVTTSETTSTSDQTTTSTTLEKWVAPVTITNIIVITEIEINNIVINVLPTKKIQIAVDWTAKDLNGTIVRTDRSIYQEAQVDMILQSQGMSVAMLRTLFLSIVAELNKQ